MEVPHAIFSLHYFYPFLDIRYAVSSTLLFDGRTLLTLIFRQDSGSACHSL